MMSIMNVMNTMGVVSFVNIMSILVGLVMGSFLNVVIARLPRGRSIIRPGSHCSSCKKPIAWQDNIPVLSYILLRGKCRRCHHPISVRYPIIESLTALLFFTLERKFGWSAALIFRHWPFVAALIAITFIDLEHRIIPDVLSKGGLAYGLATAWLVDDPGWRLSLVGAALGFLIFYGFAKAYELLAGRSGLGGGDIKLLAMLGAYVGPEGVFTTMLVSSIFGSLVGIIWGMSQGRKNILKLKIPYGPFLVIGALYHYLFGGIFWGIP